MNPEPGHGRLVHMLHAIRAIEDFTSSGAPAFRSSLLIQHAVLYDLLVIGEAARALGEEVRSKFPTIDWKRIIGLRNILTHEYYRVDVEIVWGIVCRFLPVLKEQIAAALA